MGAMHGDPGWGHAVRTALRHFAFPLLLARRGVSGDRDALTSLRGVWLSMVLSIPLVVCMTWLVSGDGSNGEPSIGEPSIGEPSIGPRPFLLVVVASGVIELTLLARAALRKPPDPNADAEGVAGWFATTSFLCYSLSLASFLMGFVGAFVTNEWTMVLAGVPFAAAGFWLVAPTRRRIANAQQQVTRAGLAVNLLDALLSSPVKPDASPGGTHSGAGTGTPPPS